MDKHVTDTNHNRKIYRRLHLFRNGETRKMHNINWCEGDMQLADIAAKNVGYNDLNPKIEYVMVRLDN